MAGPLSIVIPVYNEGDNILATLREIREKIKVPYRIYMVYDRDDDNTLKAIHGHPLEASAVELVKNRYGRGALNAIRTGLGAAGEGAVLVVMADLSDDLSNVGTMLEKVDQGYDIVCGSRYMKGGRQIGGPWFKKTLSRLAGVSLYYLIGFPTHDVTNSFKLYTKKVLNDVQIESSGGFELGMEIVVKAVAKGYKVTEVPCTWRDRSAGESRFRLFKWLPGYLRWYFLAIRNRFLPQ
ncbi:MAG TPA: glycosyltransferase [Candidatus Omnitrophota bacterium]|nr:glycosyltransferase [Candidatus Omnitrophota bacterium]